MNLNLETKAPARASNSRTPSNAQSNETIRALHPVPAPQARSVQYSGRMNFIDGKNTQVQFLNPEQLSDNFAATRLRFDSLSSEKYTHQKQIKTILDEIYRDFLTYINCEEMSMEDWNAFKARVHTAMESFITSNINQLLGTEGMAVESLKSVVPPKFREAGSTKSGVAPMIHVDNALMLQPLIRLHAHGLKYTGLNDKKCVELNFWFPLGKFSKNLLAVKNMSAFERNEALSDTFTKMTHTQTMLGRINWKLSPLRVAKTQAIEKGDFICPSQSELYDFTMFDTSQSLHGPLQSPSTYSENYDEGERRSMELRYAIMLNKPFNKEKG